MAVAERHPGGRRLGWVVFWVLAGLAVLSFTGGLAAVSLTARTFTVPSTSMENTIRRGDLMVVTRTTQVRRGDVIVEQQTAPARGFYLRRVIGLPGDRVACCDARGRITVDGKPLDETYVHPGDAPSTFRFRVTVPPGKMWLLGDHRSVSYDSRALGPLAVQVAGRVFLVWGPGQVAFLRTPATFVASGLAPPDGRIPPAIAGALAAAAGLVSLIVLTVTGLCCYAVGRRRRRRRGDPAPAAVYRPAAPWP